MLSSPLIRTERSGPDVSCPAPSGSVFLGHLFSNQKVPCAQVASTPVRRPSRFAGPENFQCRAAFIQNQRGPVPSPVLPARSNPFVTHGTVESPAKCLLSRSKLRRTATTNQSGGIAIQPFQRARDGSQIHRFSSFVHFADREPPLPIKPEGFISNPFAG